MNIGAIQHQTFPSIGYAITTASEGRTSLPVAPGMVIYSQLKHISGTPAPEGTQGININRLRVLDTLIGQLSKIRGQEVADFGNLGGNDEDRINALIEQYQKQLKTAQSAAVYTPTAPDTGLLFNILV